MKTIEFLSGAGKAFELVRLICSAVLERGGGDYQISRVLIPENKKLRTDLADVINGRAKVVPRDSRDIILDRHAPIKLRINELGKLNDSELAATLLKREEEPNSLKRWALGWIFDQKFLEEIAIARTVPVGPDEAELALRRITSQEAICRIVKQASWRNVQNAAAKLLPESVLSQIQGVSLAKEALSFQK